MKEIRITIENTKDGPVIARISETGELPPGTAQKFAETIKVNLPQFLARIGHAMKADRVEYNNVPVPTNPAAN